MIVNEISLRIENRMTENERESENRFMSLYAEILLMALMVNRYKMHFFGCLPLTLNPKKSRPRETR